MGSALRLWLSLCSLVVVYTKVADVGADTVGKIERKRMGFFCCPSNSRDREKCDRGEKKVGPG